MRVPAASTGAERSASNRRAIARRGGGVTRRGAERGSAMLGRIAAHEDFRAIAHRPTRVAGPIARTLAVMTSFALVFPGQGSQSVGMGRALADASPAAASVFAEADAALDSPITPLAWD